MYPNSQIDRLGRAVRDGTMTPEDLALLAELRGVWQRERSWLEEQVAQHSTVAPVTVSGRVKNLGTLREKLHRMNGGMSTVRDIVGVRVVVQGGREEHIFTAGYVAIGLADFTPKFIDRMNNPRCGYRAVHFEIRRDGIRSEIQVRSRRQHEWAEAMEAFADIAGRNARYVDNYDFPDLKGPTRELARECMKALLRWADEIHRHEGRGWGDNRSLVLDDAESRCRSLLGDFHASL